MPFENALEYMKKAAYKSYSKKGNAIVELNYKAIDAGATSFVEVPVDPAWANLVVENKGANVEDEYFDYYVATMASLNGNDLPVSTFMKNGLLDGTMRNDATYREKRNIAAEVPVWHKENCIQCGKCVFVCPHATIRAFLLDQNEVENAPEIVKGDLADVIGGPATKHLKYRIQVSPLNCVGCGLCVVECPGKGGKKALTMENVNTKQTSSQQIQLKAHH